MDYAIEYDIAAVILSVAVLIGFLQKQTLSTNITKKFTILGSFVIVTALLDILSVYFIENPFKIPLWLNYLINIVYQMPYHIIAFYFSICISSAVNDSGSNSKISVSKKILYIIPCLFVQTTIVTTPLTHWFFYFDENLNYCHGPVLYAAYCITVFYIICSIAISIKCRKKLSSAQFFSICVYTILVLISILIQFLKPYLLIISFTAALGAMLIFLSIDDPANYLDKTLQTFNRQAFELVVKQLISQNKKIRFFALQIKDLDNLNESLGQQNTDKFLRTFVSRLNSSSGKNTIFRISGSRFGIILSQDKKKQKSAIENIRRMTKIPFEIDNFSITPVIAMTYFSYPEDCETSEDIMAILENTLNEMPESDLGLVVPANPMILEKKKKDFKLLQLLKNAVSEEEFTVLYQPIFNVQKGKYTTAEALVRFKDSENRSLSPEEFIPIAEQNGLILDIGNIVFKKVCKFLKESHITDYGVEYIHVNLSVIQCMQPDLAEELIKVMDEYGVAYKNIKFEVTESAAIVSNEVLKNNMSRLIEKGCNFSLDDYGSGYSNNLCLLNFPFNEIKLDRTIVNAAFENEQSNKIIKHTISMVKALNMKVVAEGIENKNKADDIILMGCDFIQGFYYSRPIEENAFKEFLLTKKEKRD